MAPPRSFIVNLIRSLRTRCWAIAALSLCVVTSVVAKSESGSDGVARPRHTTRSPAHAEMPSSRSRPMHACQDATGRTTYSQFPCLSETSNRQRQLTAHDRRQPGQVVHSTSMMQRERKLLQTMERDRQRAARQAESPRRTRHVRQDPSKEDVRRHNDVQHIKDKDARPVRYRILPPLMTDTPTPGRLKP